MLNPQRALHEEMPDPAARHRFSAAPAPDEAQAEAYELLRLDLYPRFLELYASPLGRPLPSSACLDLNPHRYLHTATLLCLLAARPHERHKCTLSMGAHMDLKKRAKSQKKVLK